MAAKKKYEITGWPAVFLCVIPMAIGWFVVARATIEAIF